MIVKILNFLVEGSTVTEEIKCFEIIDVEVLENVKNLYSSLTEIYNYVTFNPKDIKKFTEAYYYFMEDDILDSISSLYM